VYARWIGPKLEPALYAQVRHDVYTGSIASQKDAGSAPGPSGGSGPADDSASSSTADEADRFEVNPATDSTKSPGAFLGFLPLIVPLLLIVANTVGTAIDKDAQGQLSGDAYEPSSW